mmetsp:Transcript_8381/g.20881  ORF Transcript_8381/g.20881 Transcript_8381/m.20881 type:complete len:307 (-) Transcript_8381:103-1023(-)
MFFPRTPGTADRHHRPVDTPPAVGGHGTPFYSFGRPPTPASNSRGREVAQQQTEIETAFTAARSFLNEIMLAEVGEGEIKYNAAMLDVANRSTTAINIVPNGKLVLRNDQQALIREKTMLERRLEQVNEDIAVTESTAAVLGKVDFCVHPDKKSVTNSQSSKYHVIALIQENSRYFLPTTYPSYGLQCIHANKTLGIQNADQIMKKDFRVGSTAKEILLEILVQLSKHDWSSHQEFSQFIAFEIQEGRLPKSFPTTHVVFNDRRSYEFHQLLVILYLRCDGYKTYLKDDQERELKSRHVKPLSGRY